MCGLQQDRRLARLSTYHVRSVGQAPFQGRERPADGFRVQWSLLLTEEVLITHIFSVPVMNGFCVSAGWVGSVAFAVS